VRRPSQQRVRECSAPRPAKARKNRNCWIHRVERSDSEASGLLKRLQGTSAGSGGTLKQGRFRAAGRSAGHRLGDAQPGGLPAQSRPAGLTCRHGVVNRLRARNVQGPPPRHGISQGSGSPKAAGERRVEKGFQAARHRHRQQAAKAGRRGRAKLPIRAPNRQADQQPFRPACKPTI